MVNKRINPRVLKSLVAICMGVVAIVSALSLVTAQQPSEITFNREPVEVEPGDTVTFDWTVTFTNTPVTYSLSIYDPSNKLIFLTEFPAVGATSPLTGEFTWPVPRKAVAGPYLAELLFYTEEIPLPFDSQAAVTFRVIQLTPTPTPTSTPTPTPTPTPTLTPTEPCTGTLEVYKCEDKNANGVCREPQIDRPLPGVEVCLDPAPDGQVACQTTGEDGYARWQNLTCGAYEVAEHLTGPIRGYYPTSPMTQQVEVSEGQTTEVTFSNVFPIFPRGIAVNLANDKVYVAFQNIKELDGSRPYPFVAVIDSQTDQVIATIPDIGHEPFGVAVANNKVYVASFGEGLVTVIDSQTDQRIKNIDGFVNPARLAVDPVNNLVYVTDHGDGQVRVIDTSSDTVVEQFAVSASTASDPYDVTFSNGFAYTTLRDAPSGNGASLNPFFLKATQQPNKIVSIPLVYENQTGSPYAITGRTDGMNTYFYVTYAKEFRNAQPPFEEWPLDKPDRPVNNPINPTHLMVVEVPGGDPAAAHRLATDLELGPFAEVGLTFNPDTNHLLGTYGGGFYDPAYPDSLACALIPKGRTKSGSVYVLDATVSQNPQLIDKPTPSLRVGNSTTPMTGDFWWRNPFDIAVNPNNNKVYVTDRCWHDYDNQYDNLFPDHEIWHDGGGAVFVFNDDSANPQPTPTPTATPSLDEKAIVGQVNLQGRTSSQGVTVIVDEGEQEPVNVTPDMKGHFKVNNLTGDTNISVTANAPKYLPAVCTLSTVNSPETNLGSVTLLSGDLNNDASVDVLDMVMVGSNFGQTGSDLPADQNQDGIIDIYDLILIGKNFGKSTQIWNCPAK
jgi:YVTN family beta-propeller protein